MRKQTKREPVIKFSPAGQVESVIAYRLDPRPLKRERDSRSSILHTKKVRVRKCK